MVNRQEVIDIAKRKGWTILHMRGLEDKSIVCSVEEFRSFLEEDRGGMRSPRFKYWVSTFAALFFFLAIFSALLIAIWTGSFNAFH